MKIWMVASALLTVLLVVGCQKKDDGPAPGGGCPAGTASAPFYGGQCVTVGQCPPGLVQAPSQASMCADVRTGAVVQPQTCGVGYILTVNGCLPQCPGQPGRALYGNTCMDAVSGSGTGTNWNTGNTGYNMNPYGFPNANPWGGMYRYY